MSSIPILETKKKSRMGQDNVAGSKSSRKQTQSVIFPDDAEEIHNTTQRDLRTPQQRQETEAN